MKEAQEKKPSPWLQYRFEENAVIIFMAIFFLTLALGIYLFLLVQYEAPAWWPSLLTSRHSLDASSAGGFLQGTLGTAGAFAASFVAIVLAKVALQLAREQRESQDKTDEEFIKLRTAQRILQAEQNAILTRSTPEYAFSFEAAAASMRLDTIQTVIGGYERKRYRLEGASMSHLFTPYSDEDLGLEIKKKIKAELLDSQLIKISGELAGKVRDPETKLYIESLAAELLLGEHFSVDKLLINEFAKLLRTLVVAAHEEVTQALGPDAPSYLSVYSSYVNDARGRGKNPLSESAYYFVYIQQQQKRDTHYVYEETDFLLRAIQNAIESTTVPVVLKHDWPEAFAKEPPSLCLITPFEFNRGRLLSWLKERQVGMAEPHRGRPDLAVRATLDPATWQSAIPAPWTLLDQTEQHVDSLATDTRWLTFAEHLHIWIACKKLRDLIDRMQDIPEDVTGELTPQLRYQYVRFAIDALMPVVCLDAEVPQKPTSLDDILPRFHRIESGAQLRVASRPGTNYDLLFEEVSQALGTHADPTPAVTQVLFFMVEMLIWLDKVRQAQALSVEHWQSFAELIAHPDHSRAIACLKELAKSPYFNRPFYGWFLPNEKCPRTTFQEAGVRFMGIHYLKEAQGSYGFQPTALFQWLAEPHFSDSGVTEAHLLALD